MSHRQVKPAQILMSVIGLRVRATGQCSGRAVMELAGDRNEIPLPDT